MQLTKREQKIIASGLVILTGLIIKFFIWNPLQNNINQARQLLIQNQSLMIRLQQSQQQLSQFQKSGFHAQLDTSSPLLVVVERSLAKTSLTRHLTSTTEQSGNTIQLSFSAVSFDELIDWLQSLWVNSNIAVTAASLQKNSTDGLVDGSFTLKQGR